MDVSRIDFVPVSAAKARLSEHLRQISGANRRVALTVNGRPSAVILPYTDYLNLAAVADRAVPLTEERVISIESWRAGREKRRQISKSLTCLFDAGSLGRKGQKGYKRKTVASFER